MANRIWRVYPRAPKATGSARNPSNSAASVSLAARRLASRANSVSAGLLATCPTLFSGLYGAFSRPL